MAANYIFANEACITCTGSDVDFPTVQGKKNHGLLMAAFMGHEHCIDVFIKKGADVNCTKQLFGRASLWSFSRPNLHYVSAGGIELSHGLTPLMYAAANGHLGPVKKLIIAGARVNLVRENRIALQLAVICGHNYKCVELLIKAGANVNIPDTSVISPLMCALRTRDTENSRRVIQMLINAGADVNSSSSDLAGTTTPHGRSGETRNVTNSFYAD